MRFTKIEISFQKIKGMLPKTQIQHRISAKTSKKESIYELGVLYALIRENRR